MEAIIKKLKDYLGLVRFSHTIFALPFALASMLMAANGLPSVKIIILILLAMVTARNSAMAFNRCVDQKIDAQNPRTQERHLPSQILKNKEVILFIGLNSFLFVLVCFFINPLAFALSPVALAIIFSYSLMKRWTALCHFVLGVALAISPIGAWIAVRGTFDLPPLVLGLALLFWVSGFDIIYSTLDKEFDKKMGLFSIPSKYGEKKALKIALVLHFLMVLVLYSLEFMMEVTPVYFIGVSAIGAMVLLEHLQAREGDRENINKAFFQANAIISVLFLVTIILDTYWN